MDSVEKQLIEGKNYSLGGEKDFTYVGKDENGYNFACFITDNQYGDIWMFPLRDGRIIIEGEDIKDKEKKYPQYRLEGLRTEFSRKTEEYTRVSKLIKGATQ